MAGLLCALQALAPLRPFSLWCKPLCLSAAPVPDLALPNAAWGQNFVLDGVLPECPLPNLAHIPDVSTADGKRTAAGRLPFPVVAPPVTRLCNGCLASLHLPSPSPPCCICSCLSLAWAFQHHLQINPSQHCRSCSRQVVCALSFLRVPSFPIEPAYCLPLIYALTLSAGCALLWHLTRFATTYPNPTRPELTDGALSRLMLDTPAEACCLLHGFHPARSRLHVASCPQACMTLLCSLTVPVLVKGNLAELVFELRFLE